MKLKLSAEDMMAPLRKKAEEAVNRTYSQLTSETIHKQMAHARKREIANLVLNGGTAPETFQEEAAMRNLSVEEFSQQIVAKANSVDILELNRQKVMLAIAAATTPQQLTEIVPSIDPSIVGAS